MKQTTAPSLIRQYLVSNLKEHFRLGKALIRFRGPFIRGWLDLRYTQCRKGGCKCTRGQPHGPFLYATLKLNGKKVYRYVGKPEDASLAKRIKNYQDFRGKLARLRKISRAIDAGYKRLEKSLVRLPNT